MLKLCVFFHEKRKGLEARLPLIPSTWKFAGTVFYNVDLGGVVPCLISKNPPRINKGHPILHFTMSWKKIVCQRALHVHVSLEMLEGEKLYKTSSPVTLKLAHVLFIIRALCLEYHILFLVWQSFKKFAIDEKFKKFWTSDSLFSVQKIGLKVNCGFNHAGNNVYTIQIVRIQSCHCKSLPDRTDS